MFRVIPGFSWVEGNRVGFGYYPNFAGRVWILPKPNPYSKNLNFFLSQSSSPLLKHTNIIKSNPFKKKLKINCQTLGRQFPGIANFLAPPPPPSSPPSSIAAVDPASSSESQSQSQSQALVGIRNNLVEIAGSLKSKLSLLSSTKAVNEISKLASNLLQFENNEEEEEAFRKDEDDDDVPRVTDDVLDFISKIST